MILEHPWWFLLIIPVVIGALTKVSSTYFSKAHLNIAPIFLNKSAKVRQVLRFISFRIPDLTKILVLTFIILALVNITEDFTVTVGRKVSYRIIISLDVS